MEDKSYTVSIGQLVSIVIKRWWIVLIATVVGAASFFAYSNYFVSPTYTTRAMLGVTSVGNMTDYQQTLIGQTIAKECSEILTANITLDRAAERLNSHSFEENGGVPYRVYTTDVLKSMIETTTSTESRYFTVSVESTYPAETKLVCDTVTQEFCDVLIDENLIGEAEGRIIHRAVVPEAPSSPNIMMNTVLGALIGIIISCGSLICISLLKDRIDSEDWLVEKYNDNIPVLAVIPDADSASGTRRQRRYSSKYGKNYSYGYGQTK